MICGAVLVLLWLVACSGKGRKGRADRECREREDRVRRETEEEGREED